VPASRGWNGYLGYGDDADYAGRAEFADEVEASLRCDDVECEPVARHDLFTTLIQPERTDALDFTGILPVVRRPHHATLASMPQPPVMLKPVPYSKSAAQPASDRAVVRGVAQASVRLRELGSIRPVVRIPGLPPAKEGGSGIAVRSAKLPPVWLLANALILIAALVTILPRVVTADAAAGCSWHIVVPGDTLGNLGWANHTNALTIAAANHIANPNLIYVGQRLCIPLVEGAHTASAPKVPAASQPATYGSAKGVKAFITFVMPYARQAHDVTGWPISMILAQWGLEQAWRVPGYTGFNFGNVAALPGEPTVNGIAVPGSPAAFAFAKTPQDGLRYYIRVAHLSYYSRVAPAARSGGPDAAARALGASPWDAGHYTSISSPGSSLVRLIHAYNLYVYDN
jgi:LysM repeat protein